MSEAKHTPGPWTLLADEGMLGRPLPGRWVVEADGGVYICLDPEWDEEYYWESIANARLIAAAPDMLDALKKLASIDFGSNGWDNFAENAAREARAAIAKALGEV